jgi:hypothetical protein
MAQELARPAVAQAEATLQPTGRAQIPAGAGLRTESSSTYRAYCSPGIHRKPSEMVGSKLVLRVLRPTQSNSNLEAS